ncbi:MFS transporter [Streptomyces sp. SS1-1]|uniref:MFS transporter n=1 Tax=Streptomyces sp. SS1-1 TaxID=2651869 RepID=UPI001CEF660C|nr:MFS transporter [Streptomyces sp. SS1-1]
MSRVTTVSPSAPPTVAIKRHPAHAVPRRRFLPLGPKVSMAVYASILMSLLGSSSAPTPLYAIYQQRWGFSPITVTVVFGVYAVAVLSSLLLFGKLSDHVGRRPVIVTALVVQVVAMAIFITAGDVGALMVGRVLQGLSVGAAAGALGAGMLDIHPRRGGFLNSFAPMLGTASGALVSGLIVQYLPAPTRLVYTVLLGVFALQALAVLAIRETVSRKSGALASMIPEFKLPKSARASVAVAAPVMFAVWSMSGLYGALGPSLMRTLEHSSSVVWGGLPLFVLAVSAALTTITLRSAAARTVMLLSIGTLVAGAAITLLSIGSGQGGTWSVIGFFVGTVIAGVGFGSGFQGGIRLVIPKVEAHERAGALSLLYVVCYIGLGIPAVIAGVLVVHGGGLITTSKEYSVALIVLALAAFAGLLRSGRREKRERLSAQMSEA